MLEGETDSAARLLEGILPPQECSDMIIVIRIRRIIEANDMGAARVLFSKFPFWYHDNIAETSQVFWSENHYIMSASSELLVREMLGEELPQKLIRRVEVYLELKKTLGLAEFLSPVYYPFTIAALLNLYDFARYPGVKELCQAVLDRIAEEVLSVALLDGSIISPSGRSYARHRDSTVGLHISIFLQFLIERRNIPPPEGEPEMALREAVRSTTYRPSERVYQYFKTEATDVELPLSPSWGELLSFLNKRRDEVALEDRMSLLWGHGAYFMPDVIGDAVRFMDSTGLWRHPHFRALAPVRRWLGFCCPAAGLPCFLGCMAGCCLVRPFALGALLTGASLKVHREGKVVLSSLGNAFNAGLPAFQQWPWAVNFAGVPIWCSFGPVGTGGLDAMGNQDAAHELSTGRVMPLMRQEENRLTAIYLSYSSVLALWNRKIRPRVRWPVGEFDEHGVEEVKPPYGPGNLTPGLTRHCTKSREPTPHRWKWARKGSAVIAQTVVGLEVRVMVRDLEVAGITLEDFRRSIHQQYGAPGSLKARDEAQQLIEMTKVDAVQGPQAMERS